MKTIKANCKLLSAQILGYGDNRFCAKIILNNRLCDCYIPCSSKLTKYINFNNTKCLVKENGGKYKYSLFAIKHKTSYILIDTKMIHFYFGMVYYPQEAIYESYTKDKKYKADIKINDNNIIEVKSVISKYPIKDYPDTNANRFKRQLDIFEELISEYKIELIFICLNTIKIINFDKGLQDQLKILINKGLQIKFYSCKLNYRTHNIYFKEENTLKINFGI